MLAALIARMQIVSDTDVLPAAPIVVQRSSGPLVIRILPVDGAARSPFLGARALLVLSDLGRTSAPRPAVLSRVFDLTRAEARVAAIIGAGVSPEHAAERLGIARVTVRNQLKAVFAKTGTHRQGELVALLSKL